jgi:hypothetical protein
MWFLFPKAVIAIAFLAAVSCEKSSPESAPLPVPVPTNDGVTVLSVGQGDLRLLRYRLTKGTQTTLDLEMDVDLETGARPGKMPTLALVTRIEVADVAPSGDATLRTRVIDAKMIDRAGATIPASAVAPLVETLKQIVHTGTLSPDGTMTMTKVDTGPASAQVAQQMSKMAMTLEQVAIRLPAVPVGVGSKWTSRKQTIENGVSMTSVTTMQIVSMDGDRIGYTSQTTLSAPDQTVDQDGMKIEMKDVGGGGSGKGTFDLSKVTVTGETTSEFRGTASLAGQTSKMQMTMTLRLNERGR